MSAEAGAAVELCSGLGGIGIALRSLGYEVTRAYDFWDAAVVAIYNHNIRGEVAARCNLHLSPGGRKLIEDDRRRIGAVDLLAAGPPCKGFSQLRNGHHDGRRGGRAGRRGGPTGRGAGGRAARGVGDQRRTSGRHDYFPG
jgi:site-specific DNA-cytosine methylase